MSHPVPSVDTLRGITSHIESEEDFYTDSYMEMVQEAAGLHEEEEARSQEPVRKRPHRFVLRLPASLHEQAARAAAHEGVSLNAYIGSMLASAVGWHPTPAERHGAAAPPEQLHPLAHLPSLFR